MSFCYRKLIFKLLNNCRQINLTGFNRISSLFSSHKKIPVNGKYYKNKINRVSHVLRRKRVLFKNNNYLNILNPLFCD